jgi:hypothetical protein
MEFKAAPSVFDGGGGVAQGGEVELAAEPALVLGDTCYLVERRLAIARMIGNSPDFLCAVREAFTAEYAWYLPAGLDTVYVRFWDNAGNLSEMVSGSIVR